MPEHILRYCPVPAADSGGANGAAGGGGAHRAVSSSIDLAAALDDVRSGSSTVALHDELAEKNRIIERLQVCATSGMGGAAGGWLGAAW